MGLFGKIFGGGGQKTLSPYVKEDRPFVNDTRDRFGGLWDNPQLQGLFAPNQYENQALQFLGGFNPQSYFSGAMGMLGGLGPNASSGLGALGGQGLLARTIGGEFTDVANNPMYQARNQAVMNQAQQFLNQNLDRVNASSQAASGGAGRGSAQAAQVGNTVRQSTQDIGNTLAQLGAQDLQFERGNQMSAMGMGANLPMQYAQLMGGFGNQMAGLGLQGMNQLAALAGGLQNRQIQGFMTPYEMNLQMMNALKSGNVGSSGQGILGSIGGSMSSLAGGLTSMFSDERVKENVEDADEDIREFLESLKPVKWTYKDRSMGDGVFYGVMAQDMEATPVGRQFVEETDDGVKMIDYGKALSAMMATIKHLSDRIRDLEGGIRG